MMGSTVEILQNRLSLEEKLSSLLIYWSIIMPILTGIPVVPSYLKYIADVIWVGLVLCTVVKRKMKIRQEMKLLALTVFLFFVYVVLGYLCQFQTAAYFVWGVRNLFRYYVAFFAYASTISEKRVEKWFSFTDAIFWINALLSAIQFVFLGVRQDDLGGVFGIGGGTNGYTIALLCVVIVRHVCLAFEAKESLWKCLRISAISLLVAAMAELKAFFVMFVLILLVAAVLTKFSFKKIALMITAGFSTFVGAQALVYWFGFDNFFSIKGILELATKASYSNSTAGDINRLSAIPTLNRIILEKPIQRLFGLGLGNCDTSSFSIFNSTFYKQHQSLHYTWFTAPKVYLETGYIGLILYILFFVLCFLLTYKMFRQKKGKRLYCQIAMIMSIICCLLSFYNASLSYEAAYMLYFVLALPFIRQSTEGNNQKLQAASQITHGGNQ